MDEAVVTDSHPVQAEILVVEDNRDEMEFLCGLLRFQQAIVTRAYTIAGALEAIGGPTRFQLAFIDLNLANSSAVEVSGDLEKIQHCLDWGYIGVLKKPYGIDSIRQVLKSHRLPTSD